MAAAAPTAMAYPLESGVLEVWGEGLERQVVEAAPCLAGAHVVAGVAASLQAQVAVSSICWSCASGQTKGLVDLLVPETPLPQGVARLEARQCRRDTVGVTIRVGCGSGWEDGLKLGKGRQGGWQQLGHPAPLQLFQYCLPYVTLCMCREAVRIECVCPRMRLQDFSAGLGDRVHSGCELRRMRATL